MPVNEAREGFKLIHHWMTGAHHPSNRLVSRRGNYPAHLVKPAEVRFLPEALEISISFSRAVPLHDRAVSSPGGRFSA